MRRRHSRPRGRPRRGERPVGWGERSSRPHVPPSRSRYTWPGRSPHHLRSRQSGGCPDAGAPAPAGRCASVPLAFGSPRGQPASDRHRRSRSSASALNRRMPAGCKGGAERRAAECPVCGRFPGQRGQRRRAGLRPPGGRPDEWPEPGDPDSSCRFRPPLHRRALGIPARRRWTRGRSVHYRRPPVRRRAGCRSGRREASSSTRLGAGTR